MNLTKKWAAMTGAVLVSGALLTGASFAATAPAAAAQAEQHQQKLDQAVKDGKLTQAEADVRKALADLRHSAMAKLKADSKAVVDQAVKDGKITQEQATKLEKHGWGRGARHQGKHDAKMTREQIQAKVDAGVKAGKLTRERADQILQKWDQKHAQKSE